MKYVLTMKHYSNSDIDIYIYAILWVATVAMMIL
jgi:hypothetical protein